MAAAEDSRYLQSTQYRLWSFSPKKLSALREKTNALARASISERLMATSTSSTFLSSSASVSAAAGVSAATSAPTSNANTPEPQSQQQNNQLPEFLTAEEEAQMLTLYTVELLRAGEFVNLPTEIRATAAIFLRRFYVTNSIMTYPPSEMMKTCLFFGAKADGFYPKLPKFAENFPKTTAEDILAGEFLLCQGLRFAFDVKHPFRALEGAIMELRRYGDVDEKRIAAAHSRAREILKFSPLVTDAYFHCTPSQIMLGALSLADRGLADRIFQETFQHTPEPTTDSGADNGHSIKQEEQQNGEAKGSKRKASDGLTAEERMRMITGAEIRDKVLAKVEVCREMLAKEPPERMAKYWTTAECLKVQKPLRRKLKCCRDPDRWDLVALQKARREQALKSNRVGSPDHNGGASHEDDGAVFGSSAAVTAANPREAKRRRVTAETGSGSGSGSGSGTGTRVLGDPFGGPL